MKERMTLGKLRELIKDLPDETEIILWDPDTSWPLIPWFTVDEDGLNVSASYGDDWNKPV